LASRLLNSLCGSTGSKRASRAHERVFCCTLGTLTRTLLEHAVASPAIFIVGDVASARQAMPQRCVGATSRMTG